MNKDRPPSPPVEKPSIENPYHDTPAEEPFESHALPSAGMIQEVPPGDEVSITGVGVCAAVVLYDPLTRRAVASHVSPGDKPLLDMFAHVGTFLPDVTRLQVFLAGASPEGDVADRDYSGVEHASKTFRENIFNDLAAGGISPAQIVKTRFNDDPRADMDVVFDTRDGKMRVRRVRF
jgi:hypothetical protein